MVGGKVVQFHIEEDLWWINTEENGEYCAIFVEPPEKDWKPELGDKLWWQMGRAYLTHGAITVELHKVGFSGVNHPLGKEYQLTYNWETVSKQRREKLLGLKEIVEEWLAATPTQADGLYDPINQPQACKAQEFLNSWKKW